MTKEKLMPKYWTNRNANIKIDKLLEQNASNVANSMTGSQRDIGGDDKVKEAWDIIQEKIKEIDPKFHEVIKDR